MCGLACWLLRREADQLSRLGVVVGRVLGSLASSCTLSGRCVLGKAAGWGHRIGPGGWLVTWSRAQMLAPGWGSAPILLCGLGEEGSPSLPCIPHLCCFPAVGYCSCTLAHSQCWRGGSCYCGTRSCRLLDPQSQPCTCESLHEPQRQERILWSQCVTVLTAFPASHWLEV